LLIFVLQAVPDKGVNSINWELKYLFFFVYMTAFIKMNTVVSISSKMYHENVKHAHRHDECYLSFVIYIAQ